MDDAPLPAKCETEAELPGLIDRILEVFIPGRHTRKNLEKALSKGIGAAGDGTAGLLREWLRRHERHQSVLRAQEDLQLSKIEAERKIVEAGAKSQIKKIEAEAKARSALYETVVSSFGQIDNNLVDRAILRIGSDLFDRQYAREQVAQLTIEQTRLLPPSASAENADQGADRAEEIDDDWLTEFWELAERKSKPEIQAMFARILSGECAKPGSFDPATLRTLSLLTKRSAMIFERICSISAWVPPDHIFIPTQVLSVDGGISNEWTQAFGLLYADFIHMNELGLLSLDDADMTIDLNDTINIGGREIKILESSGITISVTPLTISGGQLFQAICPQRPPEILTKLTTYLDTHKLSYRIVS